jgi:hypothetical protein
VSTGKRAKRRLHEIKCPRCGNGQLVSMSWAYIVDDPVKPERSERALPIRCRRSDCRYEFLIPERILLQPPGDRSQP